jgi:hypothetical protein
MRATLEQGYIVILPALLVERGHQRAVPVGAGSSGDGAGQSANATRWHRTLK